jgi:hypothetical protein
VVIADSWGATSAERASAFACDSYLTHPSLSAWRAVTIDAPAERVWSWLIQVRLAPYSYDWIDNLGRRSPEQLLDLEDPTPGSAFTAVAGRPSGEVLSVEHGEHLTARIMGAVMTYRLTHLDAASTRLVLKIVASPSRGLSSLLSLGDLVMARRQLLRFKALAEAPTLA